MSSNDRPPRDPMSPPPLPQRPDTVRPKSVRPAGFDAVPPVGMEAKRPSGMDAVRPGVDRPEDRPRTAGRPAQRQPSRGQTQRPAPLQRHDPNRPPIGRQSRSAPEPASNRLLIGALFTLVFLVLAVGVGLAALVAAPPLQALKSDMIASVKSKTGRDLSIAGPMRLVLFPEPKLTLRDVALTATPGMAGGPLVTVASLDVHLRLWPLLWRQISVSHLLLHQPVIDLRTDVAGRKSWDFGALSSVPLVRYAQASPHGQTSDLPDAVKDFIDHASDPENPSPQTKARLARLEGMTFGDVRIEDGTVRSIDERRGRVREATGVQATVNLASLASPLEASGELNYAGQQVGFDVKLASLKAMLEDRPAKFAAALKAAPGEVTYKGTLTVRSSMEIDGTVAAKSASLRALALWFGHEMPPADGFGAFALTGKLKATEIGATFTESAFSLDDQTATGTLLLDWSGSKPRVNANLRVSGLDLNRYTLAAGRTVSQPIASPEASPAEVRATAPVAVSGPSAMSIEDLIKDTSGPPVSGPQVKGYTRRAGWNTDPIPLGVLGSAEVDARLSLGGLQYREIKAGPSVVTVALKSKVLRVNFDDVQLYDGHGRGFVQIDSTAPIPVVGINLTLDGANAATLFKDAAEFELLAGKVRVSMALGAQGTSEAELIGTANGKADFGFSDGALVGYDVGGVLKGFGRGKIPNFAKSPTDRTEFSELAASFAITNGVAVNQDFRLTSAQIKATGAGTVQLPTQTVDYTVKPKLVASADGAGVTDALAGIEVPVRITGPWSSPQVAPDMSGIAKDPGKVVDAVKSVAKQLKDNGTTKKIGDAVKGLIGKDGDGANGDAVGKAKDFLNKLFKQ